MGTHQVVPRRRKRGVEEEQGDESLLPFPPDPHPHDYIQNLPERFEVSAADKQVPAADRWIHTRLFRGGESEE